MKKVGRLLLHVKNPVFPSFMQLIPTRDFERHRNLEEECMT